MRRASPTAVVPITHRTPSLRTRALYWSARGTVRQAYRRWPLGDRGIGALGLIDKTFARMPHPRGVTLTPAELGGVPVEITAPVSAGAGSSTAAAADALLYLHGGGFLFCGPPTHRFVCRSLAVGVGAPVYSVGYRQLPADGVGDAVADAYAAYRALRSRLGASAHIVVAGDSAGGFLAAKICELADLDGVPAPDALIGFSPLLDLDVDADDAPWRVRDAMQPASTVRRAQRLWDRGTPVRGARAPRPRAGTTFPPTFLTTAEDELLEPSILDFAEHLHGAGGRVQVHRWRRTVHAFPVLDGLTPESRRAVADAVAFAWSVQSGR